MFAGSLLKLLPAAATITVANERCLRQRSVRSACRRCVDSCPNEAISLTPLPRHDPRSCLGCRTCEAACPTEAIGGDVRGLDALVAALAGERQPVLGCRRAGVTANVRSGCLGFLERESLAVLALSFPAGVTLNLAHCTTCPCPDPTSRLRELLKGLPEAVRLAHDEESVRYESVDLSRRGFFSLLGRHSGDVALRLVEEQFVSAADPRGKQLPMRRRLLLHRLRPLAEEKRRLLARRLFPVAHFTERCTACTGCVGVCPTGAMAMAEGDAIRPHFLPELCSGCLLCAEACRKGGVTINRQPYQGDVTCSESEPRN